MFRMLKDRLREGLGRISTARCRRSFALNELDRRLEPFIAKRRGVFIEAGANDGLEQSNTLYFERYFGWTGLLIEPIPELAAKCRQNRPNCLVENAALVPHDYAAGTVELTYCGLMSTTAGAFRSEETRQLHTQAGEKFLQTGERVYQATAPARTLSALWDKHNLQEVDLLSLDVEGWEPMVLRGLDLARHAPRFLLIEVRHSQREEIDALLNGVYRPTACLTLLPHHSDILYSRIERPSPPERRFVPADATPVAEEAVS